MQGLPRLPAPFPARRPPRREKPGAYLLHHVELVRGVVEEGVEGVPLCATGRHRGERGLRRSRGCPTPAHLSQRQLLSLRCPACLRPSRLPPEPKHRRQPGKDASGPSYLRVCPLPDSQGTQGHPPQAVRGLGVRFPTLLAHSRSVGPLGHLSATPQLLEAAPHKPYHPSLGRSQPQPLAQQASCLHSRPLNPFSFSSVN